MAMGKPRRGGAFFLMLLAVVWHAQASEGDYDDGAGDYDDGAGDNNDGAGDYSYTYTEGFTYDDVEPAPPATPPATPPLPLSPPPIQPPPSPPPPIQVMQQRQCVATADGKIRTVSIPVGKTLDDPRLQKRLERMFNSPIVVPDSPFYNTEEGQECVACTGGC